MGPLIVQPSGNTPSERYNPEAMPCRCGISISPRSMPHPERRILFAMAEPGYFRMYGPAITEMTRRGWNVAIAFERPERRGPSPSLPPSAGAALQMLGRPPHDVSRPAATLRLGIDYVRYLEPVFTSARYLRVRSERYLPRSLRFLTNVRRLPPRAIPGPRGPAARSSDPAGA